MAALILALAGTAFAGTVPLPVGTVFTADGQTSVLVDLSASTRPGPRSAEVTVDGAGRAAELVPFLSGDLAVTIVADTSAAGAGTLPAWLSAGARFMLEAPVGTRATVIGDSAPAAVIAPPQQDPSGIVAALEAVRPHGARDTAAALTLAAQQFPDVPAGRKLTVVYTGAADAGGPSATAVADRFRAAGVVLVVATTADAGRFWTTAAEATGGFLAPAGRPVVVPALDQVQTTLRGRYLIRFPTPARRPAVVPLRVTTADLTLTADVRLPAAAPDRPPGRRTLRLVAAPVAVAVIVGLGGWALWHRSRRRRRPPPIVVAHGRATVPPPRDR
ncbi:VWA domain-containing protein [Actinoplanes sp. URMC 104]|uniref:VWA domain-containing protein n=1 Tax=Actinoplanes sp. URMC 104 TaxID=3423409 RepID=UPI003F1E0205